jgi:uncharacterized DUF497 family protein
MRAPRRTALDQTTGYPYIMNNDAFQWDDAKAESNYRKHGVDFETATEAFADPFAIERSDPFRAGYDEERFLITGMAGGQLLTVVYMARGETIRLISARRATKREHDNYYRQNSEE